MKRCVVFPICVAFGLPEGDRDGVCLTRGEKEPASLGGLRAPVRRRLDNDGLGMEAPGVGSAPIPKSVESVSFFFCVRYLPALGRLKGIVAKRLR